MTDQTGYFSANRANWNDRAVVHARSEMYALERFHADPAHLSDVVRFDRQALGDLTGERAVHLQCHIGSDTLSLARLGANVCGVDQSEASLAVARELFVATETEGAFFEANVYDARDVLTGTFDLVYSGVGALNWLPSISRWATTVASLLRPGGRLFLREGHPMLWALGDTTDGSLVVEYPYFETADPLVFDEEETYTGPGKVLTHTRTYEWNHGLAEIVTAVMQVGLTLETLVEHDGCEWQALPHMTLEGTQYKLPPEQRALVPLMYTLTAKKNAA
ncbi:MAG: class I SAM-dependent methyltransferase [Pseudomonadota bacterium]